jgi:hypothetical protein
MVENYFFDHVMPRVSCAEWKIVCAVIRETVGWNRQDAELSVDRFMGLTGFAREAAQAAILNICHRTVVERRTIQNGRQRTFRYRAVPRANLKPLPKLGQKRRQSTLPFDVTEFENRIPLAPATSVENAEHSETEFENRISSTEFGNRIPNGPSEFGNRISKPLVLRSIKERDLRERQIKNAVEKTDRDHKSVENFQTPEKTIAHLCRFCSSQHDDPLNSPAVTLYYDRFKLMPSEGFRHDIWLTAQDLILWGNILDGWWYTNAKNKRVEKTPLGIKQLLGAYEEELRKRGSAQGAAL